MLLISFLDLLILGHNTHMLRLIKSEAEIKLLRQSASLTAKAFKKVRKMPLHRNPVLCLFVCAQGGVMWGWGSVGQRAGKRRGSRHSYLHITAKVLSVSLQLTLFDEPEWALRQ